MKKAKTIPGKSEQLYIVRTHFPHTDLQDAGQKNIGQQVCSVCGFQYYPGMAEEEKVHKDIHEVYTKGVRFKVTPWNGRFR